MKPTAVMASARGVAISLVVIHHANVDISGWLLRDMPFAWGVGIFQYAAVPVFLLCAGLSLSRIACKRVQLLKAAVNYFYIYLLWTLISVLLSAYVAKANVSVSPDVWASVKAICFPRGPLWFPYGLAVMLFLSALFARLSRAAQTVLVLSISVLPMLPPFHQEIVKNIGCNIPFFYLGLLYRPELMRVLSCRPLGVLAVSLGGYVSLLLLAARLGVAYFPVVHVFLGTLAFLSLVSFWRVVALRGAFGLFGRLGRGALPILLMHDFWIHIGERLIHQAGGISLFAEGVPRWVLPLGIAVFALAMSLGSCEVLRRFHWLFMAPRFLLGRVGVGLEWLGRQGRSYRRVMP